LVFGPCRIPPYDQDIDREAEENARVADLQKLLFETQAKVTDKEILATARLNARVKAFAGRELSDDIVERINEAVADEIDQKACYRVGRTAPPLCGVR
jgi:hypothetical protein